MRTAVVISVRWRARPPASGRIRAQRLSSGPAPRGRATSIFREWTEPTSNRFRPLGRAGAVSYVLHLRSKLTRIPQTIGFAEIQRPVYAPNVRLFRLASEVLHGVEAGVFPPVVGWQCKECQFRERCWAWQ